MNLDLQKTGLVLEGGGMRGVFTCGVLDFMMDHADILHVLYLMTLFRYIM